MILRFATCELDTGRLSLTCDGQVIAVEPQVFDLIRLLAENPDRLVTKDEIIAVVLNGRIVSEGAISARIASARKVVGDNGNDQKIIRTIQRRGLQMVAPVTRHHTGQDENQPLAPAAGAAAHSRIRYVSGQAGMRLAYMVQGEGTPVVRIDAPGWNIESERSSPIWRDTADWLSDHHRQLRFSFLWPEVTNGDPAPIDFNALAKDVETVADAAGFDRFAIITESGGIHAGLRFAARHPERVSRMVIHGGYVEGRSRRTGTESTQDIFRHLIDQGWQKETAHIGASFMMAYFPEGPLDAIVDGARIFQEAVPRETELLLRDAINTVDNGPLLSQVTCPVLVVHARHDAVHPVSEARKLAEGLPDAELWILDTANSLQLAHHPLWEDYKAGLLEFLGRDTAD